MLSRSLNKIFPSFLPSIYIHIEITGNVLDYPGPLKNIMLISITYHLLNMVSSTQTLAQIKAQERIGHIKQYFVTSPVTFFTKSIQDFVKCYIKSWVYRTFNHTCYLIKTTTYRPDGLVETISIRLLWLSRL